MTARRARGAAMEDDVVRNKGFVEFGRSRGFGRPAGCWESVGPIIREAGACSPRRWKTDKNPFKLLTVVKQRGYERDSLENAVTHVCSYSRTWARFPHL